MKLVWLSDLHFVAGKELVTNHDPRARISAAVRHINSHHSDASFCLISGDLVDGGEEENYYALAEQLTALSIPYLPMVGNHDERSALKRHLSVPGGMEEFVQYSVETEEAILLCLDSQKIGHSGGEFCDQRRSWLEAELTKAGDKPAYIFLHHPPIELGLPMQDLDRMEKGEAFLDLLKRFSNIAHLFIGHVHRPISGQMAGISFTTMRSVLMQAPPPTPAWDWDSFKPAKEAPAMGVVLTSPDSVVVQFEEFCSYETGGSTNL